MLKIIVLSLAVSASPLVTRTERAAIRSAAWEVLYAAGAEPELAPEITKLKVLDRQGELVSVSIAAIEFGPYLYNCTFQYDLAKKAVVANSVRCR